eukprot:gnl/Spiro4/22580_TR11138_c0_g1_i1.p1 gnl/Spiro4/22580_TR11138_c0_g1~~gnl/Spiro4/22580_TR11138_c0_g1_i1.p1  ORF type:complete len:170 (-),score=23.76 gnl/Spiro4/22580_TR11138_c0_g1_i1:61-540(-)
MSFPCRDCSCPRYEIGLQFNDLCETCRHSLDAHMPRLPVAAPPPASARVLDSKDFEIRDVQFLPNDINHTGATPGTVVQIDYISPTGHSRKFLPTRTADSKDMKRDQMEPVLRGPIQVVELLCNGAATYRVSFLDENAHRVIATYLRDEMVDKHVLSFP